MINNNPYQLDFSEKTGLERPLEKVMNKIEMKRFEICNLYTFHPL